MTIDRAAAARWLIDRHFIGSAFGDALFHTENTVREKACSWKIMSSMKFHKTMGQLEKLCDIGAQQVFLLEAFIVEAGYSDAMPTREMPMLVREAVAALRA